MGDCILSLYVITISTVCSNFGKFDRVVAGIARGSAVQFDSLVIFVVTVFDHCGTVLHCVLTVIFLRSVRFGDGCRLFLGLYLPQLCLDLGLGFLSQPWLGGVLMNKHGVTMHFEPFVASI